MFTPTERARLRDVLVAAARADERVTGAALTGSAAARREDRWSDIDLALCVGSDVDAVVADWTEAMYRDHAAVHHVDVYRGSTLFRVFLRADTLQVDVAFWPAEEFGATGPAFELLFGTAVDRPLPEPPTAGALAGTAWLYALHARSSLARGRLWQAEYMVSGMREQVLALACLRHGLPTAQGRGIDDLPASVTTPITRALVTSLDADTVRRAFAATTELLLTELDPTDPALASRLAPTLWLLASSAVLRPAVADDADTVAEIWHSGWRDGHLGHVPEEAYAHRTLASFRRRTPAQLPATTVAVLGEEVVGFVTVHGDELEQLYVASRARGTGVADALIAAAARAIAAAGHDRAWLAVVAGNARARRFYERHGWTDAGHLDYEAATADDGTVTIPCRRYEKDLARSDARGR